MTATDTPPPLTPMRQTWLQVVQTSGARVFSLVAGVGTLAVTARWLGPAGRGEVTSAIVWSSLFYMIGFLSLNSVAIHQASRDERPRVGAMFGTLLVSAVGASLSGWLIAALLYFFRGGVFGEIRPTVLVLGFAMLPFLIWEQYGAALLMMVSRLDVYNVLVVSGKAITLVMAAAFFFLHMHVEAAMIAMLVGQVAVAAGSIPFVLRGATDRPRFDRALFRDFLRGATKLHVSAIATFLYSYSAILIINRFLGSRDAGLYQLATQLIDIFLVVPYSANIVLQARLSSGGHAELWGFQRRVIAGIFALMIVGCVVAWLLAPLLIPIVAGAEFLPSARIFRWLLIAALIITLTAMMTSQWIGRGLFVQLSAVTFAALVVNLTASFILIPRYGLDGAVAAVLISYGVAAVAHVFLAVKCEWEWQGRRRAQA